MNELTGLVPIIEANAAALEQPGVLAVRPGYVSNASGQLTREKAIVVVVARGAAKPSLPERLAGIPVDIRVADEAEQLRIQDPNRYAKIASIREEVQGGAFPELGPLSHFAVPEHITPATLAAKPSLSYTPPKSVVLKPIRGDMSILCHASPDAGWPTLREFLAKTEHTLTIGLYDFTSEHILKHVEASLLGKKTLTLTLDNPPRNPKADQTDSETMKDLHSELGDSFRAAWALNRMNKGVQQWIFPSAYHIKVAVRDGTATWLSSGNWNNSNQPDFDPIENPKPDDDQAIAKDNDRDWHVIIENTELAKTFEAYLQNDYDVAKAQADAGNAPEPFAMLETLLALPTPPTRGAFSFKKPLAITEAMEIIPLLTPDKGVYRDAMLDLIEGAEKSLSIQLQYIHPSDAAPDQKFADLVDSVVRKISGKAIDVRIILSQWQKTNGWLDRLQAAGIDLSVVKIQNRVHNKGFVVDHSVVALGSQNWSGDGALRNRDATVIIRSATAARYFEDIFNQDWNYHSEPAGA